MNKRNFLLGLTAVTALTTIRANFAIAQSIAGMPSGPELEAAIFARVNNERSKLGASKYFIDEAFLPAARAHSKNMMENNFFGHVDPQGRNPFDRLPDALDARVKKMGENIWKKYDADESWGVSEFADHALAGWMASSGHRDNIVNPAFDRAAVGVVIMKKGFYATMLVAKMK